MKQEMKSTARLAVTAGLCTSLALGGLPIEAIAAEVVVDPAQAGATADESAGVDAASTGDSGAAANESGDPADEGDGENDAKAGSGECIEPADSGNGAGAASGVAAPAPTAAPAPVDNGDGTFGITEKKVAQIGDKTYPSLDKALAAAQSGDTIQILEDCEYERQDIDGKDLTVDLCGHVLASTKFGFRVKNGSLTLDDTSEGKTGVVRVVESGVTEVGVVLDEGGSFTMKGGKIESADRGVHANSGNGIEISIEDGSIYAPNGIFAAGKGLLGSTKIFVKGGYIKGSNAAVLTNGSSPGGVVINVSGGTLESDATAMYLPGVNGKTTITGGAITGATGVEIRAGDLVISGNPTIQGSGELKTWASDNGATTTGVGVAVAQHATGKPINVIIGGDPVISGKYALYEHNPQKNDSETVNKVSVKVADGTFDSFDFSAKVAVYSEDVTGFITGGVFKTAEGVTVDESAFENLCAKDYEPKKDADGNYTVEVPAEKRVAEIDGRAYPSVQEALDAAQDGQTVILLKDATENVEVEAGKSIALDLNGKDLTAPVTDGKNRTSTIIVKGSLVLKDSTASGDPIVNEDGSIAYVSGSVICPKATVAPYARSVSVEPGGSFTLESGRLYSEDSDGAFVGAGGADAGGSMVMKGGLIDAQEYGIGVISHSSLIVEGGLVRARNNAAVGGNGSTNPSQGDTSITISGGVLRGEDLPDAKGYIACGIYHPQSGTLTVTGGKIEAVGGVGILMRAGSANITGGEVIGSGDALGYVGDSEVAKVTSSGIVVDRAANYGMATQNDVVRVSGEASIKADEGQAALNTVLDEQDSKEGLISVSDGKFSSKPDQEYCAPNYGPVQRPDGSFGVSTEQSYTVKHLFEAVDSSDYVEDASLAASQTLTGTIGQDAAASAADVKGFEAQAVTQKPVAADGSTVVEIRYDRKRHAVSFDAKGGSAVAGQTVKYGAAADEPSDPTKEGSAFLGWYVSGTFDKFDFTKPVTEDVQLVAHWVLNTYTVTLDANGGEPVDPIEMSHGYELTEPTATRTGYTLTGWKDAAGGSVAFPLTVTGDLELTAQWQLDAPSVVLTADKAEPDVHAGDTVVLTANPSHALDGATYTYQWYKGRTAIDGATGKTLEVDKDGEYTVDVVAHDGASMSEPAVSNSITLSFEKQGVAVSFAQAAVEKHADEIGAKFTNGVVLQTRAVGEVTYESSDERVATVDAKTGEVTVKGVGEAVVTAKVAATDTHEAAEAGYKLTVTDHDTGTWETVKPATCTAAGREERVCGICGHILETRAIDRLAHEAAHVPAKDATCTKDGNIEHWSCGSCGGLFADAACTDEIEPADTVVKAFGHTEKLEGAADATCTEDGYTGDKVCSVCGEVLQKGEVVPAAGHKVGAWKVAKEPTCTAAGREERVCSVCGEKESREIPPLGHKLEAVAEIPATIDATGVRAHYTCTACGELFLDAEGKQGADAAGLVIEKLEAVTVVFDDCVPDTDHVSVRLAKGGVISAADLPADPVLAGYEFLGWFLYDSEAEAWGEAFDPAAPVTADLLVGAKWKKLDGGSGEGGSTEQPADKPELPAGKPESKPGAGDKDALAQTGDGAFAQVAAAFAAGIAAIGAGLFSRRRRNE